ncbi:MAG: caspase family protein [Deltaproteobacteria bacterium]|nr:caspase family protein [Deltaproteobacteria bacterium]
MRRWLALAFWGALLLCAQGRAWAGSSVRYALIVGNNVGRSSEIDLEPLRHAEREAAQLRGQLVRYANFDPQRVELVQGGSRGAILAAAHRIAEQHRRDVAELGELPSLFALFFTGHGVAGRLLTADEPLSGEDVSAIVQQVDASLSIGFFDACFSGSLDLAGMRGKGLVSTPGFNPVAELPREVLDSEGTMWFVSSRPGELSYEDERLGGLFTHFFTEAFTAAAADGVGVTLESMWEFAVKRTASHAAKHGRRQTPEKIVRNLKERGPLYFSFPLERSAWLRMHPDVEGSFLLLYEQSTLVERIDKRRGAALEVAVFDGPASLRRIDLAPGAPATSQQLVIERGARLLVQPSSLAPTAHAPGFGEAPVRGKGALPDLELTHRQTRSLWMLEAGYRWQPVPAAMLGAPHAALLGADLARGPLRLGLELGYGRRGEAFADWSYRLHELEARVRAGWGWDLGGPRLDLEAGAGAALHLIDYADGGARKPAGLSVLAGARLMLPVPLRNPYVILQLNGGGTARWAQGVGGADHALHLQLAPILGVSIGVPLSSD